MSIVSSSVAPLVVHVGEVTTRIADHPITRIDELLPWNVEITNQMV